MRDPEVDPDPWPYDANAKKRRIVALNWVNLFGPEYVARHGWEMLAGIPGYLVEDLPDGGLLYQSRPQITVDDRAAHERWQREATQYLLAHGVRIRWRNVVRF